MDMVFGKQIGKYILLEKLGEGGMATVYNAYDSRLERNVALKVILPARQSSQMFLSRFLTEARSLAQLTHSNIVKVLDYGEEDGLPYLVMEYIPGGTLKEVMGKPLPWQMAAAILAPIARALDYVHQQNLIHRDVKPANILIDDNDQPMLSDFGVVKLLESEESVDTAGTGVGIGTPDYMSPEQGMGKEVDFRADIYALGVVFFEMVTGKKPFSGDTPMGIVIRHVTDAFPRPRGINRSLPPIVEEVILKAVAKDPKKRFRDMGVFAETLENLALGPKLQPRRIRRLLALKPGQPSRLPGGARLLLGFALVLSILAMIATAGFVFRKPILAYTGAQGWMKTVLPPQIAAALRVDESSVTPSPLPFPTPSPEVLITIITATTQPEVVVVTATDVEVTPTPETPVETPAATPEVLSTIALINTPVATPLEGSLEKGIKEVALWGIGGVNTAAWSPDGQKLAIGTTDGIFIYRADTLERLLYIRTGASVNTLVFSGDGAQLTGGLNNQNISSGALSEEKVVGVWDANSGLELGGYKYQKIQSDVIGDDRSSPVHVITYSKDNRYLVIGHENGEISLWDLRDPAKLPVVWEQYSTVSGLAFSQDNRYIYITHDDSTLVVRDIFSQKTDRIEELGSIAQPLVQSSDGNYLLTGGPGRNAFLIDTSSYRIMHGFTNLGASVTAVNMSPDQTTLAFGLSNGMIKVFRMPDPQDTSNVQRELYAIQAHPDAVTSLSFSPDNQTLASTSWQDGLKLWDPADQGKLLRSLDQSMPDIRMMIFSPDNRWLIVENGYKEIQFWSVEEGKLVYTLTGVLPLGSLFAPDQKRLVIVREAEQIWQDYQALVIDLETGEEIQTLNGFKRGWRVGWSEDGNLLVMGDTQNAILWDVSTWQRLQVKGGANAGCGQYFTPESERLAIISDFEVFFTYNKDIEVLCATKPGFAVREAVFPDLSFAIMKVSGGKLWLWDLNADEIGRMKERLLGSPGSPEELLAFSQDSKFLVVELDGNEVLLKRLNNIIKAIRYQPLYQYTAAISPNSRIMVLGSVFGTIRLYTVP